LDCICMCAHLCMVLYACRHCHALHAKSTWMWKCCVVLQCAEQLMSVCIEQKLRWRKRRRMACALVRGSPTHLFRYGVGSTSALPAMVHLRDFVLSHGPFRKLHGGPRHCLPTLGACAKPGDVTSLVLDLPVGSGRAAVVSSRGCTDTDTQGTPRVPSAPQAKCAK
jgi:hypothetical protein